MTWVKLPDDALEDPRVADVPDDALLDYLRTLGWSNRWARDGRIPSGMARPSAKAWIDAGLATSTDDGVQLVWLMEYQPNADEITRRRKVDADRQARRRRHNAGDHSTCDTERCKALKSRRDSGRDTLRESDHPDPTPTPPDPKEGGGEGRTGDDAGDPSGPVVALRSRKCSACERDFFGEGYQRDDGEAVCSWRCRDSKRTAA